MVPGSVSGQGTETPHGTAKKKKKKKNQKPLEKIYEMTNLKECCIKYDLFNGPLFTFD